MTWAYMDGEVVPLEQARVPLDDRGHLFGEGLFETMRVVADRPFRFDQHLDRMQAGLPLVGLERDADVAGLMREAAAALIEAARATDRGHLRLRLQVTAGRQQDAMVGHQATVTGICGPLVPPTGADEGIAIHVASAPVQFLGDPWNAVKSIGFGPRWTAQRAALSTGADDAVLLNSEGRVAEATTANIFARKGQDVFAPGASEAALPGITREVLLDHLDGHTIHDRLPQRILQQADEIWLSNTSGIVPVVVVDGGPVGKGQPGPKARDCQAAYEVALQAEA